MLTKALRHTIHALNQCQKSNREIAKLLNISKSTVAIVLKQGVDVPLHPKGRLQATKDIEPMIRELFTRCLGNAVRIQEVLKEEYALDITYSTLTRCIREAELRGATKRVGEYRFDPGLEMQHDTSPHWVMLGDKKIKAQCASLVLGHSRKLFMRYYPCFTRFEAKTFLKAAIEFMGGSCKRCVIDNTSVILSGGSGANAIISPEMLTFARLYGFDFMAHRVHDPDRKGKCERPFFYAETNFLAGRTFTDWQDLNQQVHAWCLRVNGKEKRCLGMAPDMAFILEQPYLVPLPASEPPIYEHYQRLVDCHGYINLDANQYSVPEKLIGQTVDVYKHPETVRVMHKHREIATHPRLMGKRDISRVPGHHSRGHGRQAQKAASAAEATLRGCDELLDQYVDELKHHVRGSGYGPLNRLLSLKRTYPSEAFLSALKQAKKYKLYDLGRLEDMIIEAVAGDYFNLGEEIP